MDPLEFNGQGLGDNQLEVGEAIYGIFSVFSQGAREIAAKAWNHMTVPAIFSGILTGFILARAVVFAAPRVVTPLNFWQRLAVRGPVLLAIAWKVPTFIEAVMGRQVDAGQLFIGDLILKASFFVELVSAIRVQADAHVCTYTYSELCLIAEDFRRAIRAGAHAKGIHHGNIYLDPDCAFFFAIALGVQVLVHIEGLFDSQRRTRFITSTIGTMGYFSHYLFMLWSMHILRYPTLAFFSSARFVPIICVLAVLAGCWTIYFVTGLIMGRSNMAMSCQFDNIYINWGETFNHNLFRLAASIVYASPKGGFLNEASHINVPCRDPYENRESPKIYAPRAESRPLNPIPELTENWKAAWSLLRPKKETQDGPDDDYDDDYLPESDFESEMGSDSDNDQDNAPPLSESIELCGGDILEHHFQKGRITRSSYKRAVAESYLNTHGRAADRRVSPETCVICLEAPRQVVLWPCGCLCMCEDCRTALGSQQQNSCVCCRRSVTGFSRVFRP